MAARFVRCFGTPSFFPKMPNIGCQESLCSTNAFATSTIFKLPRTIKCFSRQSEVVERRYGFFPISWRKMIAHWLTRRIFASTMTWITKVFVVVLNDCTNSTSSFALSAVDSGKYLTVSSCAFNCPPRSHLYTTEGLHPRVPQSLSS